MPSSKDERRVVLEILSQCGILATMEHPALMSQWVPTKDRQPPPKPSKNDWTYPMFWWRGGIDEAAARAVFGGRVR